MGTAIDRLHAKLTSTSLPEEIKLAWSQEAREAAIVARRAHAHAPMVEHPRVALPAHASPPEGYMDYAHNLDNRIRHAESTIGDTEKIHDRINGIVGAYTPARRRMHKAILKEFAEKYKNVPTEHKAIVLAGAPGAGKSSLIKSHGHEFGVESKRNEHGEIEPTNFATVNPDDIKEALLKHGALGHHYDHTGVAPGESASFLHEESSHLAKQLHKRLSVQGKNILLDGTLAGDPDKQARKVADLRGEGYSVHGVLVHGTVDNSLARAVSRHTNKGKDAQGRYQGRYVPLHLIDKLRVAPGHHSALLKGPHQNVSSVNFEASLPHYNGGYHVYDNSGGHPRLLAKGHAHG